MKKIVAILMAMIMVISVTVVLAGGADKETQTNFKKVIVGFDESPNKADEKMIRDCGGKTKYTYHIINAKAVEIPEQAIENIKKNPRVEYVEDDSIVHAVGEVTPWGVDRIDADLVWSNNKGNGVKIAIIDTGIDKDHPDLQANIKAGRNFVSKPSWRPADPDKWDDDNGHGTHCAGIVAAVDNDIGVIGVAPEAYLYGVKVLDRTGSGYESDVIAGIQWSSDNGMQVISMSLGGGYSESMETACSEADCAGIVVVAAAGNSGPGDNTVLYPAKYESVIAVSATNDGDSLADFSGRGPEVELAAPGVSIYSTVPGGYDTYSGTSMACPHVAGTAALVIYSGITDNGDVRARLQGTAEDLGDLGFDTKYGHGLVDAEAAAGSAVTLKSIAVTPETASIPKGLTQQYMATGTYSDASTADITSSVTWASTNTAVATIDSEGLATGVSDGITDIKATLGLISGTATLTVTVSILQSITVMPDSATIEVAANQQYTAMGTYSDASTADITSSVTWASSNIAVATIDSEGLATGVSDGSTGITATLDSISDTAALTVTAPSEPRAVIVESISYSTEGGRNQDKHLCIVVALVDNLENPVVDASVSIDVYLEGAYYVSYTGTTGTDGMVTFKKINAPSGTYTTKVTAVTAGELNWEGVTPENSFTK